MAFKPHIVFIRPLCSSILILHCLHIDDMWPVYCLYVALIWPLYGAYVAYIGPTYGLCMALMWHIHGPYVVYIGHIYGLTLYRAYIWLNVMYGPCMALHMAYIWVHMLTRHSSQAFPKPFCCFTCLFSKPFRQRLYLFLHVLPHIPS